MKTIGILIPIIGKGGAERVATRLSALLASEYNLYFIVFSQDYAPSYSFEGKFINLYVSPSRSKIKKFFSIIKRSKRLKKIKKKYHIDCVISFLDSANLVNILSRTKKCKSVVSIRNFDFLNVNLISKILNKYVYKKAQRIVCCSKEIEKAIKDNYNIDSKAITIYNPFDYDIIKEQAKEKMIISFPKGFKFVTMGRIMTQKGYWNLIKSFYLFHKNNVNAEACLIIIGNDFSKGKISSLISSLKLENKVFLLGQLDNPFNVLKHCDCYILSSLFEGFPNALAEAMCCGLPIIASNCKSGPKEILDDKIELEVNDVYIAKYGVIYKEYIECVEEDYSPKIYLENTYLANAMKIIYDNEQLRKDLINKSYERVKDFSYIECKQKFIYLIDSLF